MKKLTIIGLLIFNGVLICGMGLRDNPTEASFRIINPVANVQYIVATTEIPEKPEEPKKLTTEELIIRESTAAGIDPIDPALGSDWRKHAPTGGKIPPNDPDCPAYN